MEMLVFRSIPGLLQLDELAHDHGPCGRIQGSEECPLHETFSDIF
jgi:hypothetical protein